MRRTAWTAVILTLGLLGAGCGGTPDEPGDTPSSPPADSNAAGQPEQPTDTPPAVGESNSPDGAGPAGAAPAQGEGQSGGSVLGAVGNSLWKGVTGSAGGPGAEEPPPFGPPH